MFFELGNPFEIIQQEIEARGWTLDELAERMGGSREEILVNRCVLDLMQLPDKRMAIDDNTAAKLGAALGRSAEYWKKLDRKWRESE